ncbi:integrator complex subunit 7-like [Lineus longissimus]|uniref:integrator complex subunit 7-like n=1 Tax=Lineus longissimus TaxID=88925 RepID=UPI002B4CAF31
MASTGRSGRVVASAIGEIGLLGEPEKDANALLMDLDKGLRSVKVGEQCESIIRFPRLFEKYPFPILINSAFLKLGDVFRFGTNFLRLCILKVTQQSEKHLEKVINVDEFIRRIFSVIHSNDPIARAITLRTLGSMACIIPERKNVHHSIMSGLDSHDSVELEAAIVAAKRFAAQSKTFATTVCQKVSEIIKGIENPMEMKLKVIPIFQYMYHDAQTATLVRDLCIQSLPSYPACNFVLTTLHTLSELSAKSLISIPHQVKLLLNYLEHDPRRAVKVQVLQDLKMLAKEGAHLWNKEDIEALCQFTTSTSYDGLKMGALHVLTTLSKTVANSKFDSSPGSPALTVCQHCNTSNTLLASKAAELLTDMAVYNVKSQKPNRGSLCDDAASALDALAILSGSESTEHSKESLQICLKSVVKLCSVCPALSRNFISTITGVLHITSGKKALYLAESLAAIGSRQKDVLDSSMADVVTLLKELGEPEDMDGEMLGVLLITTLFQAFTKSNVPEEVCDLIGNFVDDTSYWIAYRIIRQALRYGHHQVATQLCRDTMTKVSTEHFFFWVGALESFSSAENYLSDLEYSGHMSPIDTINQATVNYYKGISSLTAATTPTYPLTFQIEYTRMRVETLTAYVQLINACTCFRTNPPPAIATTFAMSTGQEQHKCGRGAQQLQRSVEQFSNLVTQYSTLYEQSFDADPASLDNVQLLQQSCQLIVYIIETVLNKKSVSDIVDQEVAGHLTASLEGQGLTDAFRNLLGQLRQICLSTDSSVISYKHIDFLMKACIKLASVPLCMPRYFFQTLQSTTIKLAISPQPRNPNDPISIQADTHLTLKVEGVIQHGDRPGLFRKIHKVKIEVSSSLQSRSQTAQDVKPIENPPNEMSYTSEPHNDYFSSEFLLSFPVLGLHMIYIEASIIDENGLLWKTGPRTTLMIKSWDDNLQKQQLQAAQLARQQQSRLAHV